jgi:hypothetical protein
MSSLYLAQRLGKNGKDREFWRQNTEEAKV